VSGMDNDEADALFSDIEGFAGYAFNRSHAVEYTLISYQAAYLKAHYLVEFYTASMGIANDDKLQPIVKQAAADGIRVIPPDINISTNQFEPLNDVIIAAPLSAVKGVSENGARAIMEARKNPTVVEETTGRGKNKVTVQKTHGPGRFTSIEDFQVRVPARAVNSAAVDKLNRVGAFARIEPGQPSSTDPSRQRDQIELMPAISDQGVQAERKIVVCDQTWEQLTDVYGRMTDTLGGQPVDTKVGKDPKLAVILDAPFDDYQDPVNQYSYQEFVAPSMHEAGLSIHDVVWTYLGRRPKRKSERELPAAEFAAALPFLKEEIAILRPPVIVLLGPNTIKTFFPDIKSVAEHIGRKTYSAELDATVIIGFNPTQIYHDADKRAVLADVFREAKKLVEFT